MDRFKLSKSVRKHLRSEKSRIRREILSSADTDTKIRDLAEGVYRKYTARFEVKQN